VRFAAIPTSNGMRVRDVRLEIAQIVRGAACTVCSRVVTERVALRVRPQPLQECPQ
jgi:hypothetical protein